MWSSRLFWKLFLSYAGLLLAIVVILAALISARQKEQVLSHLQDRLHDDAVILRPLVAGALESGLHDGLQELAGKLAGETGTRITVITNEGSVVADSEQDPALMENHLDRPEVRLAAERGAGVWIHLSRTLGIPMMYFALRVQSAEAQVGFVRVALPLHLVEERVTVVQRPIWMTAVFVALATLLVTYLVVARITRPLETLRQAAKAITAGEYGRKVNVASRDELGTLGEAFNRMSAELVERVNQMSENQQLLVTVLGGMVEGVVAVDAAERILFANDAVRELLGLTNVNPAGRPLWEMARHGAVLQTVRQAFVCEEPIRSEFEMGGGSRRMIVLHARRLPGNPSPGVVLVLHDVTELRRLENMRRDFVANVSHELKTPLSSIKAYAETLLSGALNDSESNVQFVRQIEEQAERLHQLILDLLRLARVESGQQAFEIAPVAVDEIVGVCVAQHAAAADVKQITIATEPRSAAVRVLADEEGVRTILDNLLDNAIKYTPAGGRITIRWGVEESAARLEVVDTGIGIASQDQARIFERFYRVDKARSRELGGTGLGLSIVKHLVQAFGGSISVTSEIGRGSTFSVRLPIA